MVAEAPVELLTDPPLYRRLGAKPPWLTALQAFDLDSLHDLRLPANSVLLHLLSSPNIAAKEWVYRQYDHQVLTNTVVTPGQDAAVLRIKGTEKAIALTTDGNGRYCYLDPYTGGVIAVAEAARNVVCSGAEPLAITDCLNFGNPERPEIYYQLEECIRGMAEACRILSTPVVSGNVSLYNETRGESVYSTPVVGMLGLLEDVNRYCTAGFKQEGDSVVLLGDDPEQEREEETWGLDGSQYLESIHNLVAGRPSIDLELEKRVQECCLTAIKQGIIKSAHDCSDGGLAVALAECCIEGGIGFKGGWKIKGRIDSALFGEAQSRIVLSISPRDFGRLKRIARDIDVPLRKLGVVGGDRLSVKGCLDLPLGEVEDAWRHGLEKALSTP